jgi:SAM-dependent methyltransferase
VAKGVVTMPKLLGPVLRSAVNGAVRGVRSDPSLSSILDMKRVRSVVPDAATGVQWGGADVFLDVLDAYLSPSKRVLEIGCGGGRITRFVAPKVGDLVASDISDVMLAEARENLDGSASNVRFAQTQPYALAGLEDSSFDVVYSHDVFFHFELNHALALLDETRRVLKTGGACVISFVTVDREDWAATQLRLVREAAARGTGFGPSLGRPYVAAQLDALYDMVGLEVVVRRYARLDEEADRPHYILVGTARDDASRPAAADGGPPSSE